MPTTQTWPAEAVMEGVLLTNQSQDAPSQEFQACLSVKLRNELKKLTMSV
jgi:hypothetical protein